MGEKHIFISHATADDTVVAEIRQKLEGHGLPVWVDSRRLTGGVVLGTAIRKAIENARHVLVVLSPETVNSSWVTREVRHALRVKRQRSDGFQVVPLMLKGIKPSALSTWFGREPVGVKVEVGPGGIAAALPDLLAAIGERLPTDPAPPVSKPAVPVADLVLELSDPAIHQEGSIRRAAANATLTFYPPDPGARKVESRRYRLVAPLGPIETGELAWYLERYANWPGGVFGERAKQVEKDLPEWGQRLYAALLSEAAREAFAAWNGVDRSVDRRFTVLVDADLAEGSEESAQGAANEAATLLLSLPWELLHDARGYLFQGARSVRVRRTLPNRERQDALLTKPPIRVLLVSPRPEDERAGYIDHRVSARPLVEALGSLGDLAALTILTPPTFAALEAELTRAQRANTPYHVVHFDGHGVYDPDHGLGALVFENPADAEKIQERRSDLVDAKRIAGVIRDHRVPLFFLEACQSAMSDKRPDASVAGQLLQSGVASVAAMSHTVLVETARRFVTAFYADLMQGATVGEAMLVGRRALRGDAFRGRVFTGDLRLQDWFVPILYQEEQDPPLVAAVPAAEVRAVQAQQRERSLGALPAAPEHTFVGRSRELLAAERLLARERHVVLVGEGGEGKTALAAELARWLVATQRFGRAAFVAFDKVADARAALWSLGAQLVPGFESAAGQDANQARLLVERALTDESTVLVLDNLESVLPPPADSPAAASFEPDALAAILDLCATLGKVGDTRLVFTSREPLPSPFVHNVLRLGRLDRRDAIALVGRVLGENEMLPRRGDAGANEAEVERLVEAVNCHARALVLLAREVGVSGVRGATERLHELMAALHRKHPDDRERSLLASVELSLRRLPDATRRKLGPLGVFQGGGFTQAIGIVLGLDIQKDEEVTLARELIGVGLAEPLPHDYLRFDPALCPALLSEMSAPEREAARAAWAETMERLAVFLYRQQNSNPQFAFGLAQWELPNLLAALEERARTGQAEPVIQFATDVEALAQPLGRAQAVTRAATIRAEAAGRLREGGQWGHVAFEAERTNIERLLDAGRFAEAVAAAQGLVQRCEVIGEAAYPEAAYDLALAHVTLGRALKMGGAAGSALPVLERAQIGFETLAAAGNQSAARMASVARTERADCLTDLGRLDAAAALYQESVEDAKYWGDPRSAAVNSGQLATVRLLQKRYADALAAYAEARDTFEQLGEPASVAVAWHQMGMVYKSAGDYLSAERAYQQSLRIEVQMGNRPGEASTLGELGNLSSQMNREEESVRFHREAATIYVSLNDVAGEGRAHYNVAYSLLRLGRFSEARDELIRAIACDKPLGHVAQPWKTFVLLHNLERAEGNTSAAIAAREEAIHLYLSYRRAGGENLSGSGQVFALVSQAMATGQTEAASAQLATMLADPNQTERGRALIPALQQVLAGARDPTLAADPNLDYDDAAEILLLIT